MQVRTHVEFRTSKFPPYEGEDKEVNPGRFGKRLAEYLKTRFSENGIKTGEIYAEDWGWAIPVENPAFALWVGCGNYEEYADGFLCFIEPSKSEIRRLFRKIDTTQDVGRVAEVLDRVLLGDAEIRDVRWWSEKEACT